MKLTPPSKFYSAPFVEKVAYYWWWIDEQKKSTNFYDLDRQETKDFLEGLYWEGMLYGLVTMSFDEFFRKASVTFWSSVALGNRVKNSGWFHRHQVDFRQRMSFRRRGHQKKVLGLEEENRKAWREYKGFQRDRIRNHSYGQRKKFAKEFSNRSYRAWERKVMARGDYELLEKKAPKNFFDPWFWD